MGNCLFLYPGLFDTEGGMQIFCRNFLKSFSFIRAGISIYVISLNDYLIPDNEFDPRIKFICCGSTWRIWSKFKFTIVTLIYTLFKTPSFIICGHINISPLCLLVKKLLDLKYGIFSYGIEVWDIRNKLKQISMQNAYFIISVSSYTASKIKERVKAVRNKIFILPETVDGSKFYPREKSTTLLAKYSLNGYKTILTVARFSSLEKYKGYDSVIKVLPDVKKIIPNIKYILVGKGDDIPRLKNLAYSLGVSNNLIFTGFVDTVSDYYNLCDAFVMPSKGEGFGLVFIEALACGKPVIAGNKDAAKEVLLDGELGILVDPDNLDEIREAIISVLKCDVPSRFLDPLYLREKTIEEYGVSTFNRKLAEIVSSIPL